MMVKTRSAGRRVSFMLLSLGRRVTTGASSCS